MSAIPTNHRGYRGPRRLLVAGGALFVVSALVAAAAFTSIQASGASGIGMDIGRPLVNALLGTAGIDQIRVPKSPGSGASWLIVVTFLIAFLVAGVSLVLVAWGGVWLLMRHASPDGQPLDRRQAADAGRRQAVAVRERGSQEYAKAKPKLAEAAHKGRKAYDDDVRPRLAAGAEKAAATGRRWIEQRRNRPPGGG